MKTRSALKEGEKKKKTHKDLAAVTSAASFFSQYFLGGQGLHRAFNFKQLTRSVKRLYSHASIVSMLFITSLISKPF